MLEGDRVEVSGSFDQWTTRRGMKKDSSQWKLKLDGLEKGHRYWFKFRDVNGRWFTSQAYPSTQNVFGTHDNFIDV